MKYEKIINNFYKKNFKRNYFTNHSPLITKSEIIEVKKCIKSSFISTAGNYPELFIKKYRNYLKQIILYQLTLVHLHYTWQ